MRDQIIFNNISNNNDLIKKKSLLQYKTLQVTCEDKIYKTDTQYQYVYI